MHGDSYIGEWKNSKADGYGVHIWANGDRYEGEWKECLKHGNGTDIFANGDMYIGQYRYGQFIIKRRQALWIWSIYLEKWLNLFRRFQRRPKAWARKMEKKQRPRNPYL
jgi:hypothetical protein